MTRETNGVLGTVWRYTWLPLACVVVSVMTTRVVLSYVPAHYRSQTLILVVPQQVPGTYAPAPTVTSALSDRLNAIRQQVLSRSKLEQIVAEMNLYTDARKHSLMEDVTQRMRDDVSVEVVGGDTFRISFDGDEPRSTRMVAERLAALFMDQNRIDRSRLAQTTDAFIESQLADTRQRLTEQEAALAAATRAGHATTKAMALEYEVAQQDYRDLLAKRSASRMAVSLESRQIGEQFRLVEAARIPTEPIGPNRIAASTGAAFAGLGLGALLIRVRSRRRPSVDETLSDDEQRPPSVNLE